MSASSRETPAVHPGAKPKARRACLQDVAALKGFLSTQDIWPLPGDEELNDIVGRNDAAFFCAWCGERMCAAAACAKDGAVLHMTALAPDENQPHTLATLVDLIADFGRRQKAAMLFARVPENSAAHLQLVGYGFEVDDVETDVVAMRRTRLVELVLLLGEAKA